MLEMYPLTMEYLESLIIKLFFRQEYKEIKIHDIDPKLLDQKPYTKASQELESFIDPKYQLHFAKKNEEMLKGFYLYLANLNKNTEGFHLEIPSSRKPVTNETEINNIKGTL